MNGVLEGVKIGIVVALGIKAALVVEGFKLGVKFALLISTSLKRFEFCCG
jgi:hypothetical protein